MALYLRKVSIFSKFKEVIFPASKLLSSMKQGKSEEETTNTIINFISLITAEVYPFYKNNENILSDLKTIMDAFCNSYDLFISAGKKQKTAKVNFSEYICTRSQSARFVKKM